MTQPTPDHDLYLGMRAEDLRDKPYARFFDPRMAKLPEPIRDALLEGPLASPLLPGLADVPRLLEPGEQEVENGFGFRADGSLHVALRTELPGISPAMIDWWFGWHSAEPQRYKLWHPRAHVHARWDAPETEEQARKKGRPRYVGRTSIIHEYLGSQHQHAAIRFLRPGELGLDETKLLDAEQATVICARIGLAGMPLTADAGYLVHHVRRVAGGSEMRSRFWLGGPCARVHAGGILDGIATRAARIAHPLSTELGRDLLVHGWQEMAHLGTFLPALHAELRELP